jgi:hypothetical protein
MRSWLILSYFQTAAGLTDLLGYDLIVPTAFANSLIIIAGRNAGEGMGLPLSAHADAPLRKASYPMAFASN